MLRSNRQIGRIAWPLFGAIFLAQIAILWGTYALTGSNAVQGLLMVALSFTWTPFQRRAARTRPFAPLPDPAPRPSPKGIPVLIAAVVISLGIQWLLYRGLAKIGVYPGVWVFFMLGFLLPVVVLINRYGRQPEGARP